MRRKGEPPRKESRNEKTFNTSRRKVEPFKKRNSSERTLNILTPLTQEKNSEWPPVPAGQPQRLHSLILLSNGEGKAAPSDPGVSGGGTLHWAVNGADDAAVACANGVEGGVREAHVNGGGDQSSGRSKRGKKVLPGSINREERGSGINWIISTVLTSVSWVFWRKINSVMPWDSDQTFSFFTNTLTKVGTGTTLLLDRSNEQRRC